MFTLDLLNYYCQKIDKNQLKNTVVTVICLLHIHLKTNLFLNGFVFISVKEAIYMYGPFHAVVK